MIRHRLQPTTNANRAWSSRTDAYLSMLSMRPIFNNSNNIFAKAFVQTEWNCTERPFKECNAKQNKRLQSRTVGVAVLQFGASCLYLITFTLNPCHTCWIGRLLYKMSMSTEGPVTYVQREAPRYSAAMTIRAKAQSTGVGEGLEFNPEYFTKISGIIKLVQLVCNCTT